MWALTLLPLIIVWAAYLLHSVRPQSAPELLSEVAWREQRQCYSACYSGYSAPERCAYPQDHYGPCEP